MLRMLILYFKNVSPHSPLISKTQKIPELDILKMIMLLHEESRGCYHILLLVDCCAHEHIGEDYFMFSSRADDLVPLNFHLKQLMLIMTIPCI